TDNFWLQRTALRYQLGYREKTDSARLCASIDRVAPSREFFLRTAIGWALRQYARTDPEAVKSFVLARGDRLSGLSRREALKHLQS
ncbi:DNA alkylation repair protein, partial [bacterium CPR1]|nr:DNA alkylation repair protein [bacterium CPR1]